MKLTARLVGALMAGIVILLLMDAYLWVQRQTRQYRAEMRQDASLLGDALKGLVEDVWRTRGKEQALHLIDQANQYEHAVKIRWISQQEIGPLLRKLNSQAVSLERPVSVVAAGGDGNERMFTYVAVSASEPTMGALELSESMSYLQKHNRSIIARTAVLGTAVFAVSGGAVVLLGVWLVGRPLHQLADKARRVGDGDLSGPVEMPRRDELGELSVAMNEMCSHLADSRERLRQEQQKRIETLEQLRHADRLRTVGRLAAGVAHELGTPLNTIAMRATMLLQDATASETCRRNASIIRTQTGRLSKIVHQLLTYARPRSLKKSTIDLRVVLQQTLEFLKPLAASSGVNLQLGRVAHPAIALVDADQMQQVMTNLIMNGVQAMPGGGSLDVEVRREHGEPPAAQKAKPGDYFCISVRDEGEGIPTKNLKHVFDPFFTTKDVGEGSGLGLSIAFGIVQEHGGWIDVRSQLGKGSCFSVYLPPALASESQEYAAVETEAK
jgi:signal transduction histidine kinase